MHGGVFLDRKIYEFLRSRWRPLRDVLELSCPAMNYLIYDIPYRACTCSSQTSLTWVTASFLLLPTRREIPSIRIHHKSYRFVLHFSKTSIQIFILAIYPNNTNHASLQYRNGPKSHYCTGPEIHFPKLFCYPRYIVYWAHILQTPCNLFSTKLSIVLFLRSLVLFFLHRSICLWNITFLEYFEKLLFNWFVVRKCLHEK